MWNVKQKNDGMNQSTLFCCYDNFVTANQQTQMNKTCWGDFASLPHLIDFKDLLTACQSLLIRNVRFLTTSFITGTFHDV